METLAQFDFSDLIIGDDDSYFKNLTGHNCLVSTFEFLNTEINCLRQKLKEKEKKEFLLIHGGVQYRTARMNTVAGVFFVLRKGAINILPLQKIGIPGSIINYLLSPQRRHGLILISGKMGSGKTTTASSLVKARLELFGEYAIALEDPPELPLQFQCNKKGKCFQIDISDQQMGQAISDTMRLAPDIIFLGELRSPSGVSQALKASVNGHLIIATIHGSGIIETFERVLGLAKAIDGDIAYSLFAEGIECVLHQSRSPDASALKIEFLCAGKGQGDPVRQMIRAKTIHHLGSEIQSQKNKLFMENKRL